MLQGAEQQTESLCVSVRSARIPCKPKVCAPQKRSNSWWAKFSTPRSRSLQEVAQRDSLAELTRKAKEIAANGGKLGSTPTEEEAEFLDFMYICENRWEKYKRIYLVKSRVARLRPTDKAYRQYMKAFFAWKTVGAPCSAADFVEAQYYFFDLWFNRPPHMTELGSVKSVERAEKWLEMKRTVQPAASCVMLRAAKPTQAETFRHEARMLREMVRNWGKDEKEILRIFGAEGACVFSKAFLKSLPLWKELKSEGAWR